MSKSRLLVCSFCAGMLGFIALTLWAAGGRYLPGEQELLTVITTHRFPVLNPLALVISTFGSINILLPLWAILVLSLVICRQGDALLRFVPVPLGYPLYALVKSLIARPASTPSEYAWLYDLPIGYYVEGLLRRQLQEMPSQGVAVPVVTEPVTAQAVTLVMERGYVSGHALLALIFYGTIAWWIWSSGAAPRWRWLGTSLFLALGLLVGVARIYMGVHFPSDVLGAWLLGGVFIVSVDSAAQVLTPIRPYGWARR